MYNKPKEEWKLKRGDRGFVGVGQGGGGTETKKGMGKKGQGRGSEKIYRLKIPIGGGKHPKKGGGDVGRGTTSIEKDGKREMG